MPLQQPLPGFGLPPPPAPSGRQSLFPALFPPATERPQLAERIDRICRPHRLRGTRIRDDRLHVTLHVLAELPGPIPMAWIDAAAAAGRAVQHPPIDILFDRATRFVHSGLGGKAFVLSGDEARGNVPVQRFGAVLTGMLRRHGLRRAAGRT
jgi:2'-5' RNA ligase